VVEGCRRPETDVDPETARAIVEPYFAAAKDEFVAHEKANYRAAKMKAVRLECRTWQDMHDEEGFNVRNFAATTDDGRTVVVCPDIVELPMESVAAIIAHEFGHAYDFLYPGRFVLANGELLHFYDEPAENKAAEKARIARMKQWEHRDHDTVEAVADAIATEVLGMQIRYSGACLLQTFGPGVHRPKTLR
jgi:hypothetical protein